MICIVIESFRMGHQTKEPAAGITYPGDIFKGPIGVQGPPAVGRVSVFVSILKGDLIVFKKTVNGFTLSVKLAFSMPDREFNA